MFKKILTIALTLCLVLAITMSAYAFTAPTDIKGHWAQKQIGDWLS